MELKKLTSEDLEAMNYSDIAYHILNEEKEKMKINVLFKKVCDILSLNNEEFENKIADFFELLATDKRFIMFEDGSWDLKDLHNPKVIIDEEDDDDETILAELEEEEEENNESEEEEEDIFYDADSDDDLQDDDLEDLVVINIDDEEDENS